MRIGGPKGPGKPPITPEGASDAKGPRDAKGTRETERSSFRELLAPGASQGGAAPLLSALQRGEINAKQFVDQLVDQVCRARGATLSDEERSRLRTALNEVISTDPWFAERLRDLESASA